MKDTKLQRKQYRRNPYGTVQQKRAINILKVRDNIVSIKQEWDAIKKEHNTDTSNSPPREKSPLEMQHDSKNENLLKDVVQIEISLK